jgi:septal ring factor EnvC (AmiA/AmiB activator)
MHWSDEEVAGGCRVLVGPVQPDGGDDLRSATARALMTYTAELLAARGGTLSPQEFSGALAMVDEHCADRAVASIQAHATAQGARITALEAEKTRLGRANEELAAQVVGLQDHVSDLEKSMENARKERDEADRERARLATENVRFTTLIMTTGAERDAALADNAAMHDNFLTIMNLLENIGRHDDAEKVRIYASAPHPGAALLERMKRLESALDEIAREAVDNPYKHAREALAPDGVAYGRIVLTRPAYTATITGVSDPVCTDGSCAKCRSGEPCH